MKSIVKLCLLLTGTLCFGQTNLLDSSTWTVGTGNVNGFTMYGPTADNERVMGLDPLGESSVLWMSKPDSAADQDGGYYSSYHAIDPSKTYRLTTWIKKTGSTSGSSYFGLHSKNGSTHTSLLLDGTVNSNPYFWAGDLPQLDKWYLIVAFIHPNSYSGSHQGAMYDGVTGEIVAGVNVYDFKFATNAATLVNRALLYGDQNSTDRQYYWGPTIYEVNGQEPTITELLNPTGSSGNGDTVWTTQGNDINYTSGNVGIGTTNLDTTYKLSVGGKIRADEIKVETGWADYVFKPGYDLPSLEEVEEHIQEKGHLINIPSAEEVAVNGIELGEMNKLLLEKIEELTLYTLEQQRTIQYLIEEINTLKNKK